MKKRHFTGGEIKSMRKMRSEGRSIAEIAGQHRCSASTVWRRTQRLRRPSGTPEPQTLDRLALIKLFLQSDYPASKKIELLRVLCD